MTEERWPRVKALFQAAVERPAEERDAFLAAATGDDAALRREVESLLAADTSIGSPAKLFDTKYAEPNPSRHYDVSADGQRFLMLKASSAGDPNATPASMVVVEHWFEELKQRVNAK